MISTSENPYQQLVTHGVKIAPDVKLFLNSSFNSPVCIESCCQVMQSSIDCFSIMRSKSSCINSSIGSYCTIGSHVQIGTYERDPQSVSLSPALYTNLFSSIMQDDPAMVAEQITTPSTKTQVKPDENTPIASSKEDSLVSKDKINASDDPHNVSLNMHTMSEEKTKYPEESMVFTHVAVGNDVWIGDFAVIKDNVSIGHGAIIHQGACIHQDIPPYAIVDCLGKVCGQRYSDEIIADLLQLAWWQYNLPEMLKQGHKIPFDNIQSFLDFFKQTPSEQLIKKTSNWQQWH